MAPQRQFNLGKVTVEKAPFAVEKIYPNSDTNYTGNSAFATDGSITLTAVIAPETQGVTYYYWWERFDESSKDWTTKLNDVNTATHTGGQSKTLSISNLPENSSYQYHVYVSSDNGYNCYSEPFTVTRHQHSWTYTASGATITAKCTAEGCYLTDGNGGSVTINAPAADTLTYNGKQKAATVTSSDWKGVAIDTIAVAYAQNGNTLPSVPTDAGKYTASITVGEDNTASVKYTINKANLTVKANDATVTYGETAVSNGVTYSGFMNGETETDLGGKPTYTFSYTPGTGVGSSCAITPKGLTSDNYEIKFAPGTLTVTQREVTLTWDGYENRTYGDGKTVTATAGNLYGSDDIGVTVKNGDKTEMGAYTATATGLTGAKASNYKLPENATQEYTIGLAEQTLTFKKRQPVADLRRHVH